MIYDVKTKEEWHCLFNNWLAVDKGPCVINVDIPALHKSDMIGRRMYHFSLKSSQDFRNEHLWISIFSKPAEDQFTRAQRLTCGLLLLVTTMLTSIMFFGVPQDDPEDQKQHGSLSVSLSSIAIGVQSGLIMFPVNLIVIELFKRTAPEETKTDASYCFMIWKKTKKQKRVKTQKLSGR